MGLILETNEIYNESCLETMGRMMDGYVDITITSPPYDNLRDYDGYVFDFQSIAKELFRVTKQGGVVVWIVGDATVGGSETGTSFRQALYFKEVGFNLHDTMIWNKRGFSAVGALVSRYAPVFEYMFVLSKGKPKSFNPIKDRLNIWAGTKKHGTIRRRDGTTVKVSSPGNISPKHGQRFNVWEMSPKRQRGYSHPAPFPEQLVIDHITSWSNQGDLIYDPFMGSGTTAIASIKTGRMYVGSEVSEQYCRMSRQRVKDLNF